MTKKINLLTIFIFISALYVAGCVDVGIECVGLLDTISVKSENSSGNVVVCIDKEIFVTDFSGEEFSKIIDLGKKNSASSVSWVAENILYVDKQDELYTLNLYRPGKDPRVLLQEINIIKNPVSADEVSYMALTDKNVPIGSLNIYGKENVEIFTLFEHVYYDYEWIQGQRKIAAITVRNVNNDTFNGSVVIRDIDTFTDEIVFNGTFKINWDYIDITEDKNIIFSSEGDIYLYDISDKEFSKWQGPSGYDFRLPPSVNSSLKGHILGRVESSEGGWSGQLYLINKEGELTPVPGWPIWINDFEAVCIDLENCDIIMNNFKTNQIVNLMKNFKKKG